MRKRIVTAILLPSVILLLSLTGCRKELCYDHDKHGLNVSLLVKAGWDLSWLRDSTFLELLEERYSIWEKGGMASMLDRMKVHPGEGIACVSYHESGTVNTTHIDSTGGLVRLQEGLQDILFYNNDTEYIIFDGLNSYAEATASTRTRTRASYNSTHEDETTVNSPDMLFRAWVSQYDGVVSAHPDSISITLEPLVYKYLVIFEITEGIEMISSARGALSGMASKVYLQDGHTGDETATVLFDESHSFIHDPFILAVVSTFGAPDHNRGNTYDPGDHTFGLNLEIMLESGKAFSANYDVTEQIRLQPCGGIIAIPGIEITDNGGGGFFEVSVDDWENEENIELPL